MTHPHHRALVILSIVFLSISSLGWAQHSSKNNQGQTKTAPRKSAQTVKELSQGYTLLRELMEDESRLNQVFMVRSANQELEPLVKDIASAAKDVLQDLRNFTKDEPALRSEANGLPLIEVATRSGITEEFTKAILSGNKERFRNELLLSQIQATEYGKELLLAIAQQEFSPSRKLALERRAVTWQRLRQRVADLIY
jgi:hypothetical protein